MRGRATWFGSHKKVLIFWNPSCGRRVSIIGWEGISRRLSFGAARFSERGDLLNQPAIYSGNKNQRAMVASGVVFAANLPASFGGRSNGPVVTGSDAANLVFPVPARNICADWPSALQRTGQPNPSSQEARPGQLGRAYLASCRRTTSSRYFTGSDPSEMTASW